MSRAALATRYRNDVYNELPHFREAEKRLEANAEAIPHLGDVICEHGFHDSLGVSLLHKHFPLYDGEQLVKRYDPENKRAYMYPEAVDQRRRAYMYQLIERDDGVTYEPIEFFSRTKTTEAVPTLADVIDGDDAFLEEFADVAREFDVTDTFGLTVLHLYIHEFDRNEDMPVEVTDEEKRILSVTIEPREELNPEHTTETLWVFTPREDMSAGTVGDHGERFGPVHECSHSCTHTCSHSCNHTCVHTSDTPELPDIPSDILRSPTLPKQRGSSWRSAIDRLLGRSKSI